MTRIAPLLAALALLAGCGTDTDAIQGTRTLQAVVRQAVPGRPAAPAAPPGTVPGLTRAAVEAVPNPLMLVTIEARGATGVVAPAGRNGGVETWASADGKTLALRDGMLVATRGFGPDLISAATPSAAQVAAGGSWTRLYVTLDGEDRTVPARHACTAAPAGAERLVIVERAYDTRRMRETCTGPGGASIVNDFWFDAGGVLRQSRQWTGGPGGYVAIRRL